MKVLIVKLTSMGDLIHTLPAITDAARHFPEIQFDWVSDEAFASIPKLHPQVNQVIVSAHRRWKKQLFNALKSGEVVQFIRQLRSKKYDLIIDAQSSLKSAVIAFLARGPRAGMDRNSVREKGADLFYQHKYPVDLKSHAIKRIRCLVAQALNYPLPQAEPDYGINRERLPSLPLVLPKPYLAFVHSTTWDTKHWPESHWLELIKMATSAGYTVILPWGNVKERERSERLAQGQNQVIVLPKLSIPQQASMLAGATGAVCVDTGMGHLTAALNVPAVHLYGPTDPELIGATGKHQTHLFARPDCAPYNLNNCKWTQEPVCKTEDLTAQQVWDYLLAALAQV